MLRAIDKWLPGYLASVLRRPRWRGGGVRHLFFCIADHFEPFRGGASRKVALQRVARWCEAYPRMADRFRDVDGRAPRHTFFYPAEEYDAEVLDRLGTLCRAGYGEVEVHLHHRNDTAETLRHALVSFRDTLADRHGLLGRDAEGRPRYGFVHGNWALCNSRPDGDWCGVNEELGVLAETGCYADFTFPSAPSPTQPRTVNAIYRATDTPGRPRAHDRGESVSSVGGRVPGVEGDARKCVDSASHALCATGDMGPATSDQRPPARDTRPAPLATRHLPLATRHSPLLLVQGPLALNWHRRKWGVLPRLENGEITGANPPWPQRIRLWVRQAIGVAGRPDWVFVKVHTHGCAEANTRVLLGDPMASAHAFLCDVLGGSSDWRLHYVTAREMFNLVLAGEDGVVDPLAALEDYAVAGPSG